MKEGQQSLVAGATAQAGETVGGGAGEAGTSCQPVKGEMGKPQKLHKNRGIAVTRLYVSHLDDPATARITAWRGAFASAPTEGEEWYLPWLEVLQASAGVDPEDERAIVRDNRPLGYPTLSTLLCAASVGEAGVDVRYAEFAEPGHWDAVTLR